VFLNAVGQGKLDPRPTHTVSALIQLGLAQFATSILVLQWLDHARALDVWARVPNLLRFFLANFGLGTYGVSSRQKRKSFVPRIGVIHLGPLGFPKECGNGHSRRSWRKSWLQSNRQVFRENVTGSLAWEGEAKRVPPVCQRPRRTPRRTFGEQNGLRY